ncbi:MAG: hypothetical protein DRN27_08500 [Thermoplasmata archaeon]|nr:MAG: hypothetical protein DRN27_08500 [Thermoplasmata archaeon]
MSYEIKERLYFEELLYDQFKRICESLSLDPFKAYLDLRTLLDMLQPYYDKKFSKKLQEIEEKYNHKQPRTRRERIKTQIEYNYELFREICLFLDRKGLLLTKEPTFKI